MIQLFVLLGSSQLEVLVLLEMAGGKWSAPLGGAARRATHAVIEKQEIGGMATRS